MNICVYRDILMSAAIENSTPPIREFYGCSKADAAYDKLEKLGEGTFGEVHKAKHRATGSVVALKKILLHDEKEGFPVTALREIKILKDLDNKNIIPLVDMSIERGSNSGGGSRPRSSVYMVTPYMDHDLSGLLQNTNVKLTLPHIKCYMKQLLEGMDYLHQHNYLHRDIKTANILIDNRGTVKLADFGLARKYEGDKPTRQGAGPAAHAYTSLVVTRWYRPPELVLGESKYSTAVDMWGIGCVFGEMFKRSPILQGKSDIDQGHRIFKLLGSPTEDTMPGFSSLPGARDFPFGSHQRQLESTFHNLDKYSISFLSGLLNLNPLKRLSALGALDHPIFQADPPPSLPADLPKYAASHEMATRKRKEDVPHAPNVNPSQHPPQQQTGDYYSYSGQQPFASSGYYYNQGGGGPPSGPRNHHHHHRNHHNNYNNNRHYDHRYNNHNHHGHHQGHNNYNNRGRGQGRGRGRGGGIPPYRQQQSRPDSRNPPYRQQQYPPYNNPPPPQQPPYYNNRNNNGPNSLPHRPTPYDYDDSSNKYNKRTSYRRDETDGDDGLNYDEDENVVKKRKQ